MHHSQKPSHCQLAGHPASCLVELPSSPPPAEWSRVGTDESDAGDGPEFDVDDLFDSDDDAAALDEGIDEDASYDSGYGTEERDATITDNINDYFTAEVDELEEPL
ncbi:hypothetical protein BKA61DRAFT_575396 [Leptodontidium sp. MPI-SDFR-AT-0119]|nr:hypothetical protein BKA61DRAFT_575396 [Leptodontidium sp. MPI-SDFR-AT-0119]